MSPEVDEDPRVVLCRKAAQDLSELARREFARSTCAADHLGQPLLFTHDLILFRCCSKRPCAVRGRAFRSSPASRGSDEFRSNVPPHVSAAMRVGVAASSWRKSSARAVRGNV
jgi:hypothetical protein